MTRRAPVTPQPYRQMFSLQPPVQREAPRYPEWSEPAVPTEVLEQVSRVAGKGVPARAHCNNFLILHQKQGERFNQHVHDELGRVASVVLNVTAAARRAFRALEWYHGR